MPQEQTFRSPDFYQREIDLSAPSPSGPVGTPAGVIGTAPKGPAFVPVTVGNFDEFRAVFGDLDPKMFGPYAVNEFLKNRASLTYLRVLGAGVTDDTGTFDSTGRVQAAGFKLEGNVLGDGRHNGAVQYLVARHALQTDEMSGMPIFTDNESFTGNHVHLVRGMVMMASGARLMVLDANQSAVGAFAGTGPDDVALLSAGKFKLIISSVLGNGFTNTDSNPGVKILTASFDPTSSDYFAKVMNRDPDRFVSEQHLLYADFAVDDELATAEIVGVLSGSANASQTSGEPTTVYRKAFGAFDTRYTVPQTTSFISQPFGVTEYDLFHFEALDDGEFANTLYKVAISNIKASTDESDLYGSFTVEVRDFNDTDSNAVVLERYPNCSLDPTSDRYVAKLIGDRHVTYNFDATVESERRVIATGKYPNASRLVRIVMNDQVEKSLVPATSLPFGFRGVEVPKTSNALNDFGANSTAAARLAGVGVTGATTGSLSSSIVPPIPFRYKVTKGSATSPSYQGEPGPTELANQALYWGVKFERNTLPLNANLTAEKNTLLSAYTKFLGIEKLDVLVTGSGADTFNNNKFTLAKVALAELMVSGAVHNLTASAVNDLMRSTAYIRNARPGLNGASFDPSDYTINDGVVGRRITMATILARGTPAEFNRFSPYAKFVTFMHGGYDGLNFLDRDARRMNDKSTSFDGSTDSDPTKGGGANTAYVAPGLLVNPAGTGQNNNGVASYKTAVNVMTDPLTVNINILAIPGIRESFLTDYAAQKVRDYGLAYYVMDIPTYDDVGARLYDDSTTRPDVDMTANAFDSRAIDNNYAGTYFPDVFIDDAANKRKVKVPSSIAALGALGFNDRVTYPWFAPAGFNRAALDFVSNVTTRLNSTDRDRLYDGSRINPIAVFPRLGFVIWGQKTMQIARSALDRVNVRRLMLEVKRIVIGIAQQMVFEQNTPEVRNKFVADSSLQLGLIQAQQGIESFRVVMNETNNTQQDIDLNRLNGKIIIQPTRTIEFIAIDFIITNAGVQFV